MGLIFLVEKSSKRVQCSNEIMFQSHMRFYVTKWSATRFNCTLSAYSRPLPSEKIAPNLLSAILDLPIVCICQYSVFTVTQWKITLKLSNEGSQGNQMLQKNHKSTTYPSLRSVRPAVFWASYRKVSRNIELCLGTPCFSFPEISA